jgi:hypothetical protein
VVLAAVVGATASSAFAAGYNSDLIVGVTGNTNLTDLVYDIGPRSSLYDGETWDLSALLTTFTINPVKWGVVGARNTGTTTTRTVWATYYFGDDGSGGLTGSSQFPPQVGSGTIAGINTSITSMYQWMPAAGMGQYSLVSTTDSPTNQTSWSHQTIIGDLTTSYRNAYLDPNQLGYNNSIDFYEMVRLTDAVRVGSFTLGSNGILSFSVPSPSTALLLCGGGLVGVFSRRRRAPLAMSASRN